MKIGLYSNPNRDKNCSACLRIAHLLEKNNIDYVVGELAQDYFELSKVVDNNILGQLCDIVIAFGGDGTMLDIVQYCSKFSTPILGINFGKVGFLTELDKNELEFLCQKLINNDYYIEDRSMLEITTGHNIYYSLNEALLSSVDNCHISTVKIDIDNSYTDKIRGDGVLVSTPTGSTAYSLSCNGPILAPDVDAMLVNMICAHTLHSCPIVVSNKSIINLSSCSDNMRLIIDGKIVEVFEKPASIIIKKADNNAKFIRFNKDNFYQKLLKKLSNWGD